MNRARAPVRVRHLECRGTAAVLRRRIGRRAQGPPVAVLVEEDDTERLDVWNGLLLAPHLAAAFDLAFITVADNGAVVVAGLLLAADRVLLGREGALRVERLMAGHRWYLPWHRATCSKGRVPDLQLPART